MDFFAKQTNWQMYKGFADGKVKFFQWGPSMATELLVPADTTLNIELCEAESLNSPSALHLSLFITKKYTIINANLQLINAKIHSFYSIDIH